MNDGITRKNRSEQNKGPARGVSCKPLICLVPEAGIEPARHYERGILIQKIYFLKTVG
jgi:hypothetical protein